MPDVFQYLDYRAYLRDYFKEEKNRFSKFSHQFFARKAGINSSGFVLHVMNGERNLTKTVLLKIARAMGFSAKQIEYFDDLVSFEQAKDQSEKEFYFGRIAEKRKSLSIKSLDDQQYEFYSNWYNAAIRELITLIKGNQGPETLAKLLIPAVTPSQVRKSLRLMEELGIIKQAKDGTYSQTNDFISGGGPARNVAIVNFQKEMLRHNLEAWDRFKSNEITMNTCTLCISEELAGTIKDEIKEFKKRLFSLAANEKEKAERVYNINLNMFPVSKTMKG